MLRHALVSVFLLSVAGCSDPIYDNPYGSSGGETGDQEQQEAYEAYNEAQEEAYETAARGNRIGERGLDTLASSNTTASMTGAYRMTVSSLLSDTIAGEMTMDADFGAGTVSGTLHNSYIDDLVGEHTVDEVEVLNGTVTYAGTIDNAGSGSKIDAHADGTLTNASSGVVYDLYVDIDGNFYRYGDSGELIGVDGGFAGNIDVLGDGDATLYDIGGGYVVCEDSCQSN